MVRAEWLVQRRVSDLGAEYPAVEAPDGTVISGGPAMLGWEEVVVAEEAALRIPGLLDLSGNGRWGLGGLRGDCETGGAVGDTSGVEGQGGGLVVMVLVLVAARGLRLVKVRVRVVVIFILGRAFCNVSVEDLLCYG